VTFQNVLSVVNGCRTDYRAKQSQLLDMLGSFDSWRTGSLKVRLLGGQFPNGNLIARVGDNRFKGKDAEDKMWKIILTGTALSEYNKGTLDPNTINLFPTTTTG